MLETKCQGTEHYWNLKYVLKMEEFVSVAQCSKFICWCYEPVSWCLSLCPAHLLVFEPFEPFLSILFSP